MKSLDDWTKEELASLHTGECTGWDLVPSSYDDVKVVRAWLVSGDGQSEPRSQVDRLVTVLNWAEEMRLMTAIMLRISERNRNAYGAAGCAFCEWKYKDSDFQMPLDRVLEPHEISDVNERLRLAIIEHVKVCAGHPMRQMEVELGALRLALSGQSEPSKVDEWLTKQAYRGEGVVEIGLTEDGNVGVWKPERRAMNSKSDGVGDTVFAAIDDAMRYEET